MVGPLATSAISWGFSAASWLISPVLTHFLNKCFDALDVDPQFKSRKQILLQKLENLQTTLLPQLLILTDAAHQSPHRLILKEWLQKLRSAFYEAEHVLGLVEYQRLEKEVNSLFPSTSKFNLKKLKGKLPIFSSEEENLIKTLENLEEIVNEAMKFVTLLNLPSSSGNNSTWSFNKQYRKTISAPGSMVIGRDKDRDHIVKLLRENLSESTSNAKSYSVFRIWGMGGHIVKLLRESFLESSSNTNSFSVSGIWAMGGHIVKLLRENFSESTSNAKSHSVIGIWGMGGSGKTTLAQYVCEHEKTAKYFDCIMWVYVSENFNVHAIMRNMWESVSGSSCPDCENLDVLISQLADKLRGKKYFLVLDDVWCDKGVSEQELNQLFTPLRDGKQGSKILVTTRNEEAARALGAMDLMKLPELAHEDFLTLFMSHALSGVKVNKYLEERLRAIGEKIAEKLCRLPLAATTVAGQLRRRLDPEFWSSMLNKSLLNDTMGALFLSYQHIPPVLQRCFAFCSLFPKGHRFDHDHLVNLWIAEGFIETEDSNENMKDIANQYILELISCSFFQVNKWNSKVYSMHDLMHDLAQYASEGETFRIENGEKKEIPAHTRHIFIAGHILKEHVEKICKVKDVRTIVASTSYPSLFLKEVDLDTLFRKLRKLYVVEIGGCDFKSVPKSVVQLKNLRYLNFWTIKQDALFISLNKLYQLRFLCMNRLIPDVGRLISLQELKKIHVRMERGFELKQLEHLKDLSGSLSIYGLENVKSKEEADQAKLSDKKGLHDLLFCWDYNDVLRDDDIEILEGLCPPPQIKELIIKGYGGKRIPSWILENNDNIIHLRHLGLADCGGLEALHRINELSNLLSLNISFLPRMKSWESLPLNLTRLNVSRCLSLAFVLKEDLEMIMSTKGTRISQIVTFIENSLCQDSYSQFSYGSVDFQSRRVHEMMKLSDHSIDEQTYSNISKDLKKCLEKRLDLMCQLKDVYDKLSLPVALQKLSIETCFITDKILAVSLQGLTSLTNLRLDDIITITCIPKEVLSSLTNLLDLHIKGCLFLTSIGGLDAHSTLEKLEISCCLNLTFETSLVVASSNDPVELTSSSCGRKTRSSILNYAWIESCMPSDDLLQGLVSLKTLYLRDCPTIVNPHLGQLKALSTIQINDCPNLASLKGLSELNNLEHLVVLLKCDEELECYSDADKLPQLKQLRISRWSMLEQLVSRDGFSSLISLELCAAQQEYFSQEECEVFRFLSSLRGIKFSHCKMRLLPNLLCLHSLRDLSIFRCENLSSLPEVPPSVQWIGIHYCDEEFTRSCRDPNHPNWHKISHIPNKSINLDFPWLEEVS